jgi:hypothetical protein
MKTEFIVLSNYIINNPQLSPEGLATLCYLLASLGCEGKIDKTVTRMRFGWGQHTWYKVSRELKRMGFITEVIGNKGSALYFKMANVLDSSDCLDAHMESQKVEDGQL